MQTLDSDEVSIHIDASPEDVAWVVERWDSVVSRVVARGGSPEELQARDERDGMLGTRRRLAGVWETFLGTEPIRIEVRTDGSVHVLDGRHRIEAARRLGVAKLPAQIVRSGAR